MGDEIFGGDRGPLGSYLRWMADQAGLRDWWIDFAHDDPPGGGGFGGQCEAVYGQKRATIWIRSDWPTWDEEELRHTVLHELLHCHMKATQVALEPLVDIMGNLGASIIASNHHHALELAIDGISHEWSRQLPTPSQWLEQETEPGKE